MKEGPASVGRKGAITAEDGARIMLRCAAGYTSASALAAALGFSGIGHLALAAVVWLLMMAALLLAAGMLCGALATISAEDAADARRRRREGRP